MASKKNWAPEEHIQMGPINAPDTKYGFELWKLYAPASHGLKDLFINGITGMVFGDDSPKNLEKVEEILIGGMFARPEDYQNGIPVMSGGGHVECQVSYSKQNHFRHFKAVRLQGDLKEIVEDDYPNEDTGSVAVAVCHWLARSGFVPVDRTNCFILHAVRINSMIPDETHEEPWIGIEIDLFAHNHTICAIQLPYDAETGFVDTEDLKVISDQKKASI